MMDNIVVVISGGAGRIGSSLSRSIVSNGGKVIICDINNEHGKQLISDLGENNVIFCNGDITEVEVVDRLMKEGKEKYGKVDAAVHCAYPTSAQWGASFEELKAGNLGKDLFRQLGGAILFSQRIILYFREQGYGNLIHISSIQGISAPKFKQYEGTEMVSPIEYSAIKSGIISVTRYLAKYCKGQNIRVNCVSPGGIYTNQPISFKENYKDSCTSKGLLDASDLNGTLLYLLSDQSKYVNGQNIVVDDGWSL